MRIPFVDLRAGFNEIRTELLADIENTLDSMQLLLGPNVEHLEREFAQFIGAAHCVAVNDGTNAITLALIAAGIASGDEVILPSHTFFATAEAVIHAGAKPVFVDVDRATYTLAAEAVSEAITSRTRGIVAVHLYGHPADMEAIARASKDRDIVLIEDAAQAHGARIGGRMVGTFGRAAAFSCYYTKNLGAYGEAGLVTAMDDDVAMKVRLLRHHGHATKEEHVLVGFNARMDEIQAVVLRMKLRRLAEDNRRRQRIAQMYVERLTGLEGLVLPQIAPWAEHVFHLFVVRHPARDRLRAFLSDRGIASGIHYAIPVHRQPAMQSHEYGATSLPTTERIAKEILSLPMYPQLTELQVDEVCDVVRAFARGGSPSVVSL